MGNEKFYKLMIALLLSSKGIQVEESIETLSQISSFIDKMITIYTKMDNENAMQAIDILNYKKGEQKVC